MRFANVLPMNRISKNGIMNYKVVSKKAKEIIEAYDVRTQGEHELARALIRWKSAKAHYRT